VWLVINRLGFPLAARASQETIPVFPAPVAQQPAALFLTIPVIVEIKAVFCPLTGALSLPSDTLFGIAQADGRALLNGASDRPQAGIDVVVLECPDAGSGILSHGLCIVCNLVPALTQAWILEKGHCWLVGWVAGCWLLVAGCVGLLLGESVPNW
jgi:hypothetical protein